MLVTLSTVKLSGLNQVMFLTENCPFVNN